jgi:hypothetical protein
MSSHDELPPGMIEAFLIIEQPRQRIGHWSQALAALDSRMAPPLAAVHAYYDPIADQALVGLRYQSFALGARFGFVVEVVLLAEVGMVQPSELGPAERSRFFDERLGRCAMEITTERTVVGALTELVRRVKDARTPRPTKPPRPPPVPKLAKGTRDDLSRPSAEAVAQAAPVAVTSRHVVPRRSMVQPPARAPSPSQSSGPAPVRAEPPTVPVPPNVGATPYLPTTAQIGRDMIHARYLRGGRWVPIRIGALSLKGAALLSGALPRLHDRVDVALSFGTHRALVRGAVAKVSSVRESQATGAATFTVDFELDVAARRQLTELLTAARAAKVTIKPPPPRATRRFPVDWPVCVGSDRGAIKGEALDISVGGMFVRPMHPLPLGALVSFSVVLDDDTQPVGGRAKIVRHIAETMAQSCGIQSGYGLSIVDMYEAERMRWLGFLARIERRAEKRVLIGASPGRLAELQAGLEACGYAVTGGTDPGALVQLARTGERPVDVALIDAGWLQNGASTSWVESLFSARDVPCVTLQGDARRARVAIDRILEVVV